MCYMQPSGKKHKALGQGCTHTRTFFVGSMLVTGTEMSVEALRRPSRRVSMARPLTSSLRPSSTEAILWRGMSSLSGTGLAIM